MDISRIKKPTLLLNEVRARKNIAFMAGKARGADIAFRPHFKTHQSGVIGEWFRDEKVDQITVSSVTMCKYFMEKGWKEITIAFPANPAEIEDINEIAEKINLNVLVTDFEQLSSFAWKIRANVGVYIKIDTGYRRSGIDWNRYGDLLRIAEIINEARYLRMEGLLTHSGHTYGARGKEEVISIFNDTKAKLLHTREIIPFSDTKLSIGDTPSCSLAADFSGISEIRPGNFVFYDLTQSKIGSCSPGDIAVAVACPIVSLNHHHNEAILYGGAVHLSKEYLTEDDGTRTYGRVVSLSNEGWIDDSIIGSLRSVSQEHGVVSLSEHNGVRLKPGDIVAVIPVHSCLTTDLMRNFTTMDGKVITDFCLK
jgi:D-serine deaminase-like pyridoxal phosphate-dependent protein